jgi:tRNA pseudouridine38-40 synthase
MDAPKDFLKHKFKITLSYDGTNYCGWQVQPNGVSIQELLQQKLEILLKHKPSVIGAGRTDAGVHALGQVAHFQHHQELNLFKLQGSLNGLLPTDIRVRKIEPVSEDFHARYNAINKEYHYQLNLGTVQDPFARLYSWHIAEKLDLELLKECAQLFVGTHDFSSFANEPATGAVAKNPIRTIKRIDLIMERYGARLEFEGASFLYKMVRNLTGTIIEVARGKRALDEIHEILAAKDRRRAGNAAPAHGLFLMRVDYP